MIEIGLEQLLGLDLDDKRSNPGRWLGRPPRRGISTNPTRPAPSESFRSSDVSGCSRKRVADGQPNATAHERDPGDRSGERHRPLELIERRLAPFRCATEPVERRRQALDGRETQGGGCKLAGTLSPLLAHGHRARRVDEHLDAAAPARLAAPEERPLQRARPRSGRPGEGRRPAGIRSDFPTPLQAWDLKRCRRIQNS